MQKDRIISVLIGLIGACNNNPKTDHTDALILNALAWSNDGDESDIIRQIHAEKDIIAPGCVICATPCGNTSDFDMDRIYNAEITIRNLKQQVLTEICQLATAVLQNSIALTEENMLLFYKALSYVSYDLTEQTLFSLLEEIKQRKLQLTGDNND